MMKKNVLLKIIVIAIVLCIMLVFLSSCASSQKKKYYANKENYISATGTISSITYNEDATILYLGFSELSPSFDDVFFKIVGENLQIVLNNDIDTKLKVGTQVTFITAPKYFGDGYVMPIVAISIGEESFLKFEDGYPNLLDWLSK